MVMQTKWDANSMTVAVALFKPRGGAERFEDRLGFSRVPVPVGFGVSRPEQARLLAPHADGVVVGTAIVRGIERAGGAAEPVAALVRSLRQAL